MELNPTIGKTAPKHIDFGQPEPLARKKATILGSEKKLHNSFPLPHTKLVGIPTIECMEFVDTEKIIRCEGLQKCTLIVTTEKSDIISSYNLGKFVDLLEENGFFYCHRSHLINLKFVKKYTREIMKDYASAFHREINGRAVTVDNIKYYYII